MQRRAKALFQREHRRIAIQPGTGYVQLLIGTAGLGQGGRVCRRRGNLDLGSMTLEAFVAPYLR